MPATLADIRTKVRRLTRAPAQTQITDVEIDVYINDFLLYDLPEHLRIFALRESFSWTCEPNIDTYSTDENSTVPALIDFDQNYITVHQPIFIAGSPAFYSEDRGEFFGRYPRIQYSVKFGQGNGALSGPYTTTLANKPILQRQVLISSVDINNNPLAAIDFPTSVTQGNLVDQESGATIGTINYITGAVSITWATPPKNGVAINAQTVPYVAGKPAALLYFDNSFTIRPVPDQPYVINFEVYKRPTALIDAGDTPELHQWWQYIAYGAAKKVFEDRTDLESVQLIMPEFEKQELLVNRRTIVQQTARRTSSIYANQVEYSVPPWGPGTYKF